MPERLAMSGFLLECLQPDTLDNAAESLARTIAGNAPLSVRASKLAVRAVSESDAIAMADAATLGAATFESEDYAEGRRAFALKRTQLSTGR